MKLKDIIREVEQGLVIRRQKVFDSSSCLFDMRGSKNFELITQSLNEEGMRVVSSGVETEQLELVTWNDPKDSPLNLSKEEFKIRKNYIWAQSVPPHTDDDIFLEHFCALYILESCPDCANHLSVQREDGNINTVYNLEAGDVILFNDRLTHMFSSIRPVFMLALLINADIEHMTLFEKNLLQSFGENAYA